ncbi:MAG: hypothetical protein DRI57_29200 [Deltaproteobacteria bacterium]|nr:MAG: hypothetical protein DRI57_29200 [Deltaproteobacteria bacterium]
MYVERLVLETDHSGNLRHMPKLPANKRFETVFLMLRDMTEPVRRTPHPDIVGKISIMGNIFSSTASSDWDFS